MSHRLRIDLACVSPPRIAETIGTVDPSGLTFDLSPISRGIAEQLSRARDPLVFPEFLTRGMPKEIVRHVAPPGLTGRWETTALASSVDFEALIDFPSWTAQVFVYAGLCLLLLGLMAWLGSHRLQRRAWGRRLALSGGGLFVVGSAWSTFLNLLTYVLG